jgi:hypothetical protein
MTSLRRCTLYRLQEIGVIHSVNGARHERMAQWFTSTTAYAIARIAQPKFAEHIDGSAIPRLLWRQKDDCDFMDAPLERSAVEVLG